MRTLVVTPIEEEMRAFESALGGRGLQAEPAAVGRLPASSYYEGRVLVLQGGLGNAQFGVRTQHALDNVEEVGTVVCAGVAGALSEKLSVGDVVVATATIEHDFNWLRGERPAFQGHGPYVSALREQVTPPGSAFKLHFGPVASGDEAIVDMARARELHESTGALAVAWEGAGGARAAAFSGVPFVEVRGISDMADREAPDVWKENIQGAMGNVAAVLDALFRVIAQSSPGERA